MMKGRNNGKKLMAVRIVAHAFEIIHLLTDQNPIQVPLLLPSLPSGIDPSDVFPLGPRRRHRQHRPTGRLHSNRITGHSPAPSRRRLAPPARQPINRATHHWRQLLPLLAETH
jgi:hypothetical protein